MVSIPKIQYTPVDDVAVKVKRLRTTFFQQKTRSLDFRIQQLRKLYWAVKDREDEMKEALRLDLNKSEYDAYLAEIGYVENDIIHVTKNLKKWAKDEKAEDIQFPFTFMKPTIRKDPFGVVLVIGAFNVPFQLTLGPLIGAIAAGNTVVVKPSETSSNCAVVMQQIMEASLDPDCYTMVQGGIPETQALLAERWDKICFTGSPGVGKIIAKAAAPTLTPVLLELGGRNPAFITKNANLRLAARRLVWGKTFNAGQICTSQNYVLADKSVIPELVAQFKLALQEYYPNGAKNSPDYCCMINEGAFHRVKSLIDSSDGKILVGGQMDEKERFIEPTIVQVESVEDALMKNETFGPVITILPVNNLDEAIQIANDVDSTPLGVYPFGTKQEVEKVLGAVRSGGVSVNDSFMHVSVPNLPFGGVGESGTGCYHGRASFDAFSHKRSIVTTPGWVERGLGARYPPYAGKLSSYKKMSLQKPNFNRDGDETFGLFSWIVWLLTLGGGASKSGAARSAGAVIVAIAIQQFVKRGAKL